MVTMRYVGSVLQLCKGYFLRNKAISVASTLSLLLIDCCLRASKSPALSSSSRAALSGAAGEQFNSSHSSSISSTVNGVQSSKCSPSALPRVPIGLPMPQRGEYCSQLSAIHRCTSLSLYCGQK